MGGGPAWLLPVMLDVIAPLTPGATNNVESRPLRPSCRLPTVILAFVPLMPIRPDVTVNVEVGVALLGSLPPTVTLAPVISRPNTVLLPISGSPLLVILTSALVVPSGMSDRLVA